MNATFTSPSYVSVGSTTSGAEYDISATGMSGGETLMQWFATTPVILDISNLFSYLGRKLRLDAFATADAQDRLTISAVSDTGNISTRAGIVWDEVR